MSSTGAQDMHRVMASVTLQSYGVTAEQYGVQKPIGVFAMSAKACFQLMLLSSTGAQVMHRVGVIVALQSY